MKLYKTAQLAPVSTNDLPAIQGWLQSMAGQGLLLDACDNATFFFNREAPVQRRYRIDPSKGNTMGVATPQLQDMYREFGWTYVDSYSRYHHVFFTDDPDAVEPFTTPEALAKKLEKLKRKRLLSHVISTGILLLLHIWAVALNPSSFHIRDVLLFLILIGAAVHDLAPLLNLKQKTDEDALLKLRHPEQTDRFLRFVRISCVILLVWLLFSRLF